MSDAPEPPAVPESPRGDGPRAPAGDKSYGNMGPAHWSRARAGENREALEYYRSRSQAAGVREGGGARNHYCMQCDGVIPFDHEGGRCPHCGAGIEGGARRYFNWVELDAPPPSDLRALLPVAGALALLVAIAILAVVLWIA